VNKIERTFRQCLFRFAPTFRTRRGIGTNGGVRARGPHQGKGHAFEKPKK